MARTPDRMTYLKRTAATAEAFQLECELISPKRARELYPVIRTDDLKGAIWLPGDGKANPTDLTFALARGARDHGVTIRERTRVTGILTQPTARSPASAPTRATSRPNSWSTAPASGPRRSARWAG